MDKHERELDLRRLLYHILCSWKWLIISALLFSLLLGGYSVCKSYKKEPNKTSEEAILDLKNKCSKEEQNEVLLTKETYDNKLDEISSYESYLRESLYMKLDPVKMIRGEMVYFIDVPSSEENQKDGISKALGISVGIRTKLESNDTANAIRDRLDLSLEDYYINELIYFDTSVDSVLTVYIAAETTDQIEKICDVIQERMPGIRNELNSSFGDFEITLVNRQLQTVNETIVSKKQQDMLAKLSAYEDELKAIDDSTKSFSSNAAAYYQALSKGNVDSVNISFAKRISVKFVLLGIAIGILLTCFICLAHDLCTDYVRGEYDLPTYMGITTVGIITNQSRGRRDARRLHRLLYKRQYRVPTEQQITAVAQKLTQHSGAKDESICIVPVGMCKGSSGIISSLITALCNRNVKTMLAQDVLFNSDSIQTLSDNGMCLLVLSADSSTEHEMNQVIELCVLKRVKIIGSVLID